MEPFYLIGYGRQSLTTVGFRELIHSGLKSFLQRPFVAPLWQKFAEDMHYVQGAYDDPTSFAALVKKVDTLQSALGRDIQLVFYLATPPAIFYPILKHLGACGLAQRCKGQPLAAKVVIEKPFGRDLESARVLNRTLGEIFNENQVFRIDHYLGKETVQDLLVQRFANAIFEPIWNRQYVECVQITVAEAIGVGNRGGYYDTSGALRDMIQNHTMQLLALIAMEPPVSLDPEAIRDEKVKFLQAIQPIDPDPDCGDVVRGQYTQGRSEGEHASGYREESGIPAQSATESYVALRLCINNWRWQGVPFYLRSGKRLACRVSEIAVQFKSPPGILFTEGHRFDVAANTMVIQIQPKEEVTLLINSKVPGLETRTQPIQLNYKYAAAFGSNTPEAYERLILDALLGDSTLFIRSDETETAWRLLTPLLECWQSLGQRGLEPYPAGSWGPDAACRLWEDNQHLWRCPCPTSG